MERRLKNVAGCMVVCAVFGVAVMMCLGEVNITIGQGVFATAVIGGVIGALWPKDDHK